MDIVILLPKRYFVLCIRLSVGLMIITEATPDKSTWEKQVHRHFFPLSFLKQYSVVTVQSVYFAVRV